MKKILCSLLVLLGISAGLHAAGSGGSWIEVNFTGLPSYRYEVDDFGMTVGGLKAKIEKQDALSGRPQYSPERMFFGDALLDNEKTLNDYNIVSGSILEVVPEGGVPKGLGFKISVRGIGVDPNVPEGTGLKSGFAFDDLRFKVNPYMKISELKEKVSHMISSFTISSSQNRAEVPVDEQQLRFKDVILEDARTMAHYGIQKDSVLNLEPKPAKKVTLSSQEKTAIGVTLAALTAAVTGYITKRLYQNKKKRLVRKYNLGNLTKLQDKIWLATTLASYGVPQRLRSLVRNNPGTLASFTGKDPRALAELYYGHAPSQKELDVFIQKFFNAVS